MKKTENKDFLELKELLATSPKTIEAFISLASDGSYTGEQDYKFVLSKIVNNKTRINLKAFIFNIVLEKEFNLNSSFWKLLEPSEQEQINKMVDDCLVEMKLNHNL